LELDRAHRRDGLEVAAEGGHAHVSQLRHVLHPEGLGVVVADPSHCLADMGKAAVGEADLADGGAFARQ
jgi:hypothetical protein